MAQTANKPGNGLDAAKAEKAEYERMAGLVEAAIKVSTSSLPIIAKGFAAALYRFVDTGRADLMNKLYIGLARKDAYGMTAFAIRSVMDKYASDGMRDPEDESKWRVRPTQIMEFRSNPSKDTPGEHFRIVNLKDNKRLNAAQIKAIKATKRAILAAGEQALADTAFWDKPDAFKALETEFDASAFRKRIASVLKAAAAHADSLGISVNELRNVGRLFQVGEKSLGDILGAFNDGTKEPEETEETGTTPDIQGEVRETLNA